MTVIEGVGTWPDMCRACHLRPCGCASEAGIRLAFESVCRLIEANQPEAVKARLRKVATVIDSLPVRDRELDEVIESLDGNVCMACGFDSLSDVCDSCFGAMTCAHECRRDECLFCAEA